MKLKEAMKTIQPRYLSLMKWFLLSATFTAIVGIVTVLAGNYAMESRYLTILAATLACQGVCGAVLFDCMHRRLQM